MGIGLTAQGIQQGYMWMAGTEWLDSMLSMKPYWLVRTVAGASMDIGMSLLVYNLARTVIGEKSSTEVSLQGAAP